MKYLFVLLFLFRLTDTSIAPAPTAPCLLGAGGKFVDLTFGFEILQVTDVPGRTGKFVVFTKEGA